MTIACIFGRGDIGHAFAHMARVLDLVCPPDTEPPAPWVERRPSAAEAMEHAQVVVLAGNSEELRALAEAYGPHARGDQIVLTAARGIRKGFELPHETIRAHSCVRKIGVFGGPLHAQDVETEHHATIVLASRFPEVVSAVDGWLPQDRVTVEASTDLIGVSVAGAYGHVSSTLIGLSRGLGWTSTAEGLLVAHGMVEARRLGVAAGADPETFRGIAGWGELLPRAPGRSNRHGRLGEALIRGESPPSDDRLEVIATVAEASVKGRALGLATPVADAVGRIIDGAPAKDELQSILRSPLEPR